MKTMFKSMLTLQDSFNRKLNENWLYANYRWDYALMQEYSEAFAYIPYKWWKKETIDKNQLIMEMVDIFHFGMSFDMVEYNTSDLFTDSDIIDIISDNYTESTNTSFYEDYITMGKDINNDTFDISLIQELLKDSIHSITDPDNPTFNIDDFLVIWNLLGLSTEDLYKKYIGKNVLNIFRQDHGYKSGEYIKIWNGQEDNEHLTSIINSLNCDEHLYNNVYSQLERIYQSL